MKFYNISGYQNYILNVIEDNFEEATIGTFCASVVPAMSRYPASTKHHHVYDGGLLVHTAEVLNFIDHGARLALQGVGADVPMALAAAILHDHRKMLDYEKDASGNWVKSVHGETIYHVADGYAELKSWWYREGRALGYSEEYISQLGHCLLAHHGRLEWRSPVEPKTPEAYLLHWADMWSVEFGPGSKVAPWA